MLYRSSQNKYLSSLHWVHSESCQIKALVTCICFGLFRTFSCQGKLFATTCPMKIISMHNTSLQNFLECGKLFKFCFLDILNLSMKSSECFNERCCIVCLFILVNAGKPHYCKRACFRCVLFLTSAWLPRLVTSLDRKS